MNEKYFLQVERELSLHPLYGEYSFISDLVFHTYIFMTELLSEASSDFRRLHDRFRKFDRTTIHMVIQDPVMRDVINKSFGLLKAGNPEGIKLYNEILDYTVSILDEAKQIGPLKSRMEKTIHLGSSDSSPWIWFVKETNNHVIEKHFETLFRRELAAGIDPEPFMVIPDEKTQNTLQYGFELLNMLLPDLSKNVLPHVQMIVIVDALGNREHLFESASTNDIPNAIFLSTLVLDNPIKTAEALLHETLHKKYADLLLIKPILKPGYSAPMSRPIYITWRDTHWPVDRVLAAFHVYTYLGLYYLQTIRKYEHLSPELRKENEKMTLYEQLSQALEKASYLGNQLIREGKADLGSEGKNFVRWLYDQLGKINELSRSVTEG